MIYLLLVVLVVYDSVKSLLSFLRRQIVSVAINSFSDLNYRNLELLCKKILLELF